MAQQPGPGFLDELALEPQRGTESDFRLLKPFEFRDANGRRWRVPTGTVVNGASIPRWLWPLVGHPWSGDVREASVIHDHFCETKSRTWQDVHRAFHDALIANGVSPAKARLLYAAVYRFGPRWSDTPRNFQACTRAAARMKNVRLRDVTAMCADPHPGEAHIEWTPPEDRDALTSLEQLVARGAGIAEIESAADAALAKTPLAASAEAYGLLSKGGRP